MSFGNWQQLIDVFLAKNSELNLSAIRDPEGVYTKHIVDSLEAIKVVDFADGSLVVDVGTGGWFPLLPLAIQYPKVRFVWLDARRKKTDAIKQMAGSLGLANVDVVWARVEEYVGPKADYVTARAVAHVEKLIPWMLQVCKKGGTLILYKEYKEDEKKALEALCKKYKLGIFVEHNYSLFEGDIQRVVYVII